jgi:hypothetical protein
MMVGTGIRKKDASGVYLNYDKEKDTPTNFRQGVGFKTKISMSQNSSINLQESKLFCVIVARE